MSAFHCIRLLAQQRSQNSLKYAMRGIPTAIPRGRIGHRGFMSSSPNGVSNTGSDQEEIGGTKDTINSHRSPKRTLKVRLLEPALRLSAENSTKQRTFFNASADNLKPLYKADYEGFSHALRVQNRVPAWLKFGDIVLDETVRKQLTLDDLEKLIVLLSKHNPPKFMAIEDVIRTCDELGMQPSMNMFSTLIYAYGSTGKIADARKVVNQMKELGVNPTIDIYNQFINIAAKYISLDSATEMLDKVIKEGHSLNAESYAIMISECVKEKRISLAHSYFDRMEKEGISPTPATILQLVRLHTAEREYSDIEHLFQRMVDGSLETDAEICGAMLQGFLFANDMQMAEKVYSFIFATGITPSPGSFSPFVKAKVIAGDFLGAHEIIRAMENATKKTDVRLHTAFIYYASMHGYVDHAMAHCNLLKSQGINPSLNMYRWILQALAKEKRSNEAYAIFDELQAAKVPINIEFFNAVIMSAVSILDISMIKKLWRELYIGAKPLLPTAETFSLALDAYTSSGNITEALATYQSMVKAGFQATSSTHISLVTSCIHARKYHDASQAIVWMRQSFNSRSLDLQPILSRHCKDFEDCIIASSKEIIAQEAESALTHSNGRKIVAFSHPAKSSPVNSTEEVGMYNQMILDVYKEFCSCDIVMREEALGHVMLVNHRLGDLIGVAKIWTQLYKSVESPSPESVSILIQAAADLGQERTANAIRVMVEKDNLPLNLDGYQALIQLSARCGMADAVIHTLLRMVNAGHKPTAAVYRNIKIAFNTAQSKHPEAQKTVIDFLEENYPEIIREDQANDLEEKNFRLSLLPKSV
ncbi:hypothetical protein BASA62_005068 [Batrachochytrium salamandrivorans]|nr:hypothetical protein BASA62_005068 [Batrachochytrium salamandrivorans]